MGAFPMDMLRRDQAFTVTDPHRGADLYQARDVEVMGLQAPTKNRWQSFGWVLVQVGAAAE